MKYKTRRKLIRLRNYSISIFFESIGIYLLPLVLLLSIAYMIRLINFDFIGFMTNIDEVIDNLIRFTIDNFIAMLVIQTIFYATLIFWIV